MVLLGGGISACVCAAQVLGHSTIRERVSRYASCERLLVSLSL